ncbi:E3 ubiquitin-protein ligase RNF34 isoform X1 [Trematomus bernacchii]|uniref:E3 ubiquitin-protein ligase RNF34 isoform X1 n=1 Tax=Trematomus bernacchii TaxID=40690 RepID=UPI00146B34D3|nr:E3 ubiquitin-protein ligase RNF34 isoform X1 [Trematomus bernacchii]
MKAGASSMWASCCGLLNEVMGTGTVRAQQPGFGAGAGPFRFAPSAGYSTYPPTASGSAGQLCKACGLAFSVFRRKHICCDCKKSFCALCSVLQEELRCCSTCHLLRSTAFQRPRLMQLRVKDLRQYLLLRNISTDTCREKEDLVDLVLCHQGTRETPTPVEGEDEEDDDEEEEEEDEEDTHEDDAEEDEEEDEGEEDTDSLHSLPHSRPASPPSATRSASEQSALSASQGDVLSPSDSSGTSQEQEDTPTASLLNLEPTETLMEVSPATQRRIRASLSDLDNEEAIENLSVRQLKEILARNFVNYSGCCEKWELLERVHRLYRENEHNRKSMENVSLTPNTCAVVAYPPPLCNSGVGDGVKAQLAADDNLCRICMDAIIDCVLLECGHMVTCTKCGKRMSECPICRQYVVRAVHVFKS